jgi:TolB-like protein/Flp pilus assembly protein TadD
VTDSVASEEDTVTALATRSVPTVAVLYLENLSGNKKEDYFAAGMTEDIIGGLAGIHGLRVLSRQEVKPYRDQTLGIRDIGAALKVDYVMEGSVRRDKETLRVNAQLVKVADGTLLWNQRFDRSPKDIFAVQAEIAAAITEKMEVQFSVTERDNLARVPTSDLRAYDFYLQGRTLRDLRSKEDNKNSEKMYRRALDRDAAFTLAMVGLADVYLQRLDWGFDFNPKWMTSAVKMLEQARRIDSTTAYFHRIQAIRYRLSGDFDRALSAAGRAVEIHPHDPYAHYSVGTTAEFAGEFAQARRALERALELKPDWADPYRFLSFTARLTGRVAEAEHYMNRALELSPAAAHIRSSGGWFSLWRGQFDQAAIDFGRAVALKENTPSFRGNLGMAMLLLGQTEESIALLKNLGDSPSAEHLWSLGWAYTRQGKDKNARRAFAGCRKACEKALAINHRRLGAAYRILWIDCLSGDVSDPTDALGELVGRDLFSQMSSERPLSLAGIHAATGNQAGAIDFLAEVLKTKHYAKAYIAALPEFESLRNNSDFRKLVGLNETK